MIKLPEKCPTAFYKVIYDQCGGFVDCQANAQTIWDAAIAEVERLNSTAQPVSDGLYRIANHIAGAKNALPQEWQDWAEEIESDLRKLAAAPGGQDS